MHTRAIFTDHLPELRIENGLAFVAVNRDGHEVCTTVHNFELFLEHGRRAMVAWHAKQCAAIVPFPGKRKKRSKRGKG